MKKEDLRIDIINGRLTVFEVAENHGGERGYAIREGGLFSRTLQLPHGVKEDEIKAAMENGVLTVTFPKADKEVEPRRITIA
ncbi:hypothetical protein V5O48_007216 [Marasmius crinis-equi]|uniref:SHSP domain-containing protein n=1 Tax=Marasmius crinis-equi TaxID=585013 RepID=A0ABR3FHT3_9AGAR